ncbi:unnamed protein product [Miscanthus lutarioriparius]|uniref:Uncharacterized protein n=1 Tax=Miscanthus lutarioriparius TaxID=422564 RepID=A0A811PPT2_9POAL|nr:unnamed protein product [Miscanthus lutarioriparius]
MDPSTAPWNLSQATASHPTSSGSIAAAAPTQSVPAAAKTAVASALRGSGGGRGCGDSVRRSASARSPVAAKARNGSSARRKPMGMPRSGWRRPRGDTARWSAEAAAETTAWKAKTASHRWPTASRCAH